MHRTPFSLSSLDVFLLDNCSTVSSPRSTPPPVEVPPHQRLDIAKWLDNTDFEVKKAQAEDAEDWDMFSRWKRGELEDWQSVAFEEHELDFLTEDSDKAFIHDLPIHHDHQLDYDAVLNEHFEVHVYAYFWTWDSPEIIPALPHLRVMKGEAQTGVTTCPHLPSWKRCARESCQMRLKPPMFEFVRYHRKEFLWDWRTQVEDLEYYDHLRGWSPLQPIPVLSKKQIVIIRRAHEDNANNNFANLGLTELVRENEARCGLPRREVFAGDSASKIGIKGQEDFDWLSVLVDANWITKPIIVH